MRRALSALVLAPILIASGCGGDDDSFPRDEFVDMVSANGVKTSVAECTYDAIADDSKIMDDLKESGGPTNQISSATAERLSRVIAACLLGLEVDGDGELVTTTTEADEQPTTAEPEPTTTTEPERTTTTRRGDSDTTTTTKDNDRPTTTAGLGTRSGSN